MLAIRLVCEMMECEKWNAYCVQTRLQVIVAMIVAVGCYKMSGLHDDADSGYTDSDYLVSAQKNLKRVRGNSLGDFGWSRKDCFNTFCMPKAGSFRRGLR